jgi:hypothetical protein
LLKCKGPSRPLRKGRRKGKIKKKDEKERNQKSKGQRAMLKESEAGSQQPEFSRQKSETGSWQSPA